MIGRDIAGGMDLDFLGADHRPAALGLDAAHGRERRGIVVAHAVAMGHLVEAVLGGDRADLDRLEQDVVARIARHSGPPDGSWRATLACRSAKKQAAPRPGCLFSRLTGIGRVRYHSGGCHGQKRSPACGPAARPRSGTIAHLALPSLYLPGGFRAGARGDLLPQLASRRPCQRLAGGRQLHHHRHPRPERLHLPRQGWGTARLLQCLRPSGP